MNIPDQTEQARKASRWKKVLSAPVDHSLAWHNNRCGLFYSTDVAASPFDIWLDLGWGPESVFIGISLCLNTARDQSPHRAISKKYLAGVVFCFCFLPQRSFAPLKGPLRKVEQGFFSPLDT